MNQPTTPKVHRKVVTVSSKVGSFTNHKPQGGNVQIFSENRTYNVQSKIGSLNNVSHTPGGGNVRIPNMKLDFKEKATPKIDAKSDYVPLIPEKKAITQKLNWTARSKIGSLDNVKHKPAGGNVQILDQKLQWHATSKVGSRDNIGHKPGGGNVQIFDERIQYVSTDRKSNSGSLSNMSSRSRTASRTTIDVLGL
uniref:Microtubule-associated protein n=1 Tax=Angiostrongylus cantonensis TaxID=6313 RepID=A0A158P9W8_ANGCA